MTGTQRGRVSIGFGILLIAPLAFVTLAVAQDQPQKADIKISMTRTMRDGKVFTPVSGYGAAAVGEAKRHYFYTTVTGNPSGGGENRPPEANSIRMAIRTAVVDGRIVAEPVPVTSPDYDYLWQVDVKPTSIALDIVAFDLDWTRTDVRDGARQIGAGDHRSITLRQGERHLLDFVPCSPDASCANLFLEVQAAPVEDPSVAETALAYDLWLVHQTSEGERVTRHALVGSRQGEKVAFNFAPVPLPLDAIATPDADRPYCLYVAGTIAGRVRPDGTIELALLPARRVGFPKGGLALGEGAKTFLSRPDETTSVALPPVNARSQWRADAGFTLTRPRPGVSLSGDLVIVDMNRFLQNTSTSILVTVHKEK